MGRKMNNEPVAWMDDFGNVFEMKNKFFHIPLYTHPSKDLTDEEMMQIADETLGDSFDYDIMWLRMFVKAILRKAQEK
jgi:hypothetical protein